MSAKTYRYQIVVLVVSILLLIFSYLPLVAPESTLDRFAREDGILENLTAGYLMVTSLVFVYSFFRFRRSSWLLRLSFLGLALFFFVGAGEEISWGERIFDWDDRNIIRGINVQEELTLHNLKYFQGEESILPVSISQLFIAFTFVFALVIPLVCRFFPRLEQFLSPIFPVMPLNAGILVLLTYVLQKAMVQFLPLFPDLYQHPSMPIAQGVHEMREHGYTLALMVGSIFYFLMKLNMKKKEESAEFLRDLTGARS